MPSKSSNTKIPFGQTDKVIAAIKNKNACFVFFPDCFVERIVIDSIASDFKKVYGPELTIGWFEDNFMSPGLFGGEGPYLVLESDKLTTKVKDFLTETTLPDDNRIIFFSHKKMNDKKIFKVIDQITYEGPRFWEMNKYIDVLADFFKVRLNPQVKNYLTQALEPEAASYYNALMILSAYSDQGDLSIDLVKSLIRQKHLDNFSQADLFNSKNLKRLFMALLVIENDYDIYRGFFSFIQGHILKLMDSSYASQKARPSKYDQGIISASRRWSREELTEYLELFSNLEIMSKQRSVWLRDEIRKLYLAS